MRAQHGVFGAILALYLLLSLLLFNQIEEDAFIYFRLVGNIADGYGYVFNRGGERIEAGSSPLWMLLLLLVWNTPLDIVIAAKLLGLVTGGIALWLLWRLSRLVISDPALQLGPPLLTVASTPFLMWSQRGLETPLFLLIVLWFVLCCIDPRRLPWWLLPGGLLFLARPEGPVFLLALPLALGLDRRRWRAALPSILTLAAGAVFLLSVRFLYFHDFVPSPFYVKLHTDGDTGVGQIWQYVVGNCVYVFGIPLLLIAWQRRFWTQQRVILAASIAIAGAWCALAKDYMPYVRQLVPAIPLVNVLLVSAAEALVIGAAAFRRAVALAFVAGAFVVALWYSHSGGYFGGPGDNPVRTHLDRFVTSPGSFARATAGKFCSPSTFGPLDTLVGESLTLSNFQSLIGDFLRRNYPPDSLVVYDQMGQTPFYAGPSMRFIDTLGLTDSTIGRAYFNRRKRRDSLLRFYDAVVSYAGQHAYGEHRDAVTGTTELDYIFARDPDLLLVNALMPRHLLPGRLRQDPRLNERYELRHELADLVLVYERRTTPRKQRLDLPDGLDVWSY